MQSSNPEAYRAARALHATDHERDAFDAGYSHAHGIACHNVPTLGAEIWTESEGRVVVDADNIREVHESLCFEAESNARSYSPWEFTAHKINSLPDGDVEDAWVAYDDGVASAIAHDLATYSDDDYGIEESGDV